MEGREELSAWRERLVDLLEEDYGEEELSFDRLGAMLEQSTLVEVLAFKLGPETFGFDIQRVSEILRPRPITALPRAPEFILGVISLRGMILSVADTAKRLGIGNFTGEKSHRLVVVKDGEERMGFAVDSVVGVVRFSRSELESTEYAASVDPYYLVGIGYDSKRQLVALLDTDKLCDFRLEAK